MANNPSHCSSSARTDRKLIERNRRNEMKALLSKLSSLLPSQNSREGKALPEQIEEATNYIKKLQMNVEKLKEKKEKLLMGMQGKSSSDDETESKPLLLLQVQARPVASNLVEVLLVTSSDYHLIFSQILQLLQQNGADILNIHQSMLPDRVLHKIVAQVVEDGMAPGAGAGGGGGGSDGERICERVKKFVSEYKDGEINL